MNSLTVRGAMALSIMTLSAMMFETGCSRSGQRPNVAFEANPRPVLETIGVASSWGPKLDVDTSGTVYILAMYEDNQKPRLGFAMSHDGGDTFMTPVPVSDAGASISSHGESSPSVASTSTEIYTVWEQSGSDGHAAIMSARSLSYGHGFERPVQVTDTASTPFAGFSSLAAAPNGDVYVVWLDGRDGKKDSDTFSVYVASSDDHGASFGKNVRVSEAACPCCRPRLAFGAAGEIFVAWRKVFPGNIRDMVLSTSTDRGQAFSAPVRIAQDKWKINGCPDSGPALARTGTRLYVAWMTEAVSGRPGVKLSWSDDGGRSFAPAVLASGKVLDANHPALSVADDGSVLLTFQGREPASKDNWTPLRPFLAVIGPGAQVSQPVAVFAGSKPATYPDVVAGTAGRVFLAWTQPDANHGESAVYFLRGRRDVK